MRQPDLNDIEQPDDEDPMQHLIGQQLKAVYNEVLEEPVPDRLLRLIEQLDRVTSDDRHKGS